MWLYVQTGNLEILIVGEQTNITIFQRTSVLSCQCTKLLSDTVFTTPYISTHYAFIYVINTDYKVSKFKRSLVLWVYIYMHMCTPYAVITCI